MENRIALVFSVFVAVLLSPTYVWADGDLSAKNNLYTLFNPGPESALRAFCADRPSKSDASCTVDPGHFQIEVDLLDASFHKVHAATADTYFVSDPTLKLGLTNTVDLEVSIAPFEINSFHSKAAATSRTIAGIGDLYTRVKWNFLGAGGGPVSIALSPYIKLPTAGSDLGNGAIEEGLLVPIQFNLPQSWSLGFNIEADDLKDEDDTKRHVNFMGAMSLSHPLSKTLSGSVELWNDIDEDPKGTTKQMSFDFALNWIPADKPNFQLDGGINFGLNAATPGAQVYFGVSQRF